MIKVKDPSSNQANGILKWENQPILYKILTPQYNIAQLNFVAHNIDKGYMLHLYGSWKLYFHHERKLDCFPFVIGFKITTLEGKIVKICSSAKSICHLEILVIKCFLIYQSGPHSWVLHL
jgi:hypothetical protein